MKMSRLAIRAVFLLSTVLAVNAYSQKKVVCYYGSWATWRPGNGKFDIEDIDTTLCTHVIYSFVGIGSNGEVTTSDPGGLGRFTALRNRNPRLKTIAAIGGWSEGSARFSSVVNNAVNRRKFVNNIVEFLKKYGFQGFDLDWEYPTQRGGSSSDRASFSLLIQELRREFDKYGYSLSAAVPASKYVVETCYDMVELGKNLDFINVMSYDLHGSWEPVTGNNAPLYASPSETGAAAYLNVDSSISYWLEKGVPSEKIIMGVPLYGRTWTLRNQYYTGVGAPATGAGEKGPYTQEPGMLGYSEVCRLFQMGGWTSVWDSEHKVPFAYKGNQWVSYDNVESIKTKATYALQQNLGGIMIWSIETDDFKGTCSGTKFPLLVAINSVLGSRDNGNTGENINNGGGNINNIGENTNNGGGNTNNGGENTNNNGNTNNQLPPSTGICTKEGYTRDPYDCEKFYYCTQSGSTYIKYPLSCSGGLAFDKQLQVCNYKDQVNCN